MSVCCDHVQAGGGIYVMPECLTVIVGSYNNALSNTGVSYDVSVRMDVVALF